jgi:hypothetical protein
MTKAANPSPHSIQVAGIAGATGAALVLFISGFESEALAFTASAVTIPLLGWGIYGLSLIHREGRTKTMSAGFWIAEAGVALLTIGYLLAAIGEAVESDTLPEIASATAIAPGFSIFLPIGLGLFGFVAMQTGTMGSWKRLVPSLTAVAGVIAPQFLLLGFMLLGYAIWAYARKLPTDTE